MQSFVYRLTSETNYRPTVFNKKIPSRAAISAFRALLRQQQGKDAFEAQIVVMNITTRKQYFYKFYAIYSPTFKQVNNNMNIVVPYKIAMVKMPPELVG